MGGTVGDGVAHAGGRACAHCFGDVRLWVHVLPVGIAGEREGEGIRVRAGSSGGVACTAGERE